MNGWDYSSKVLAYARRGFVTHCHVNGEYFRGLLLALAALAVARLYGNRRIVTFHAGRIQPFFQGWRRIATWPWYRLLFYLSDDVICNQEGVRAALRPLAGARAIHVIPAFSRQYLEFAPTSLEPALASFVTGRRPVISTYLCFREGFFTDVVLDAMRRLVRRRPMAGLVIVGTGDDRARFERALEVQGLQANVHLAGNLERNAFMTLMATSDLHLRTPVTDGVSSTVLEALSLRVPVVASDNGSRPAGVVTYPATDAAALAEALDVSLCRRDELVGGLPPLEIEDTARIEADLLTGSRTRIESSEALDAPCRALE
jgi:glycosyltransferase involved in cell wall biosynthesis